MYKRVTETRDSSLPQQSTASRPTYKLVQVLRAVAALMVVIYHSIIVLDVRNNLHIRDWVNGASGVDIFFVISGFVMMLSSAPLASSPHPAKSFLYRRIERIVPMYWFVTTLKLLLLLSAPNIALSGRGGVWHVVASYLFLPSRNPQGVVGPLLTVGWTLNFEMVFYLLFAIALASRLPRLKVMAPILLGLSAASLLPFIKHNQFAHFYASSMNVEFLLGMLIAHFRDWVRKIPLYLGIIFSSVGLLAFVAHRTSFPIVWRGTFCTMIMVGAVVLEPHIGHRTPRWLLGIGDSSYSLYLVHGFVLPAVAMAFVISGHRSPSAVLIPVVASVIASVFAGELAYRMVERPAYDWLRRRGLSSLLSNLTRSRSTASRQEPMPGPSACTLPAIQP